MYRRSDCRCIDKATFEGVPACLGSPLDVRPRLDGRPGCDWSGARADVRWRFRSSDGPGEVGPWPQRPGSNSRRGGPEDAIRCRARAWPILAWAGQGSGPTPAPRDQLRSSGRHGRRQGRGSEDTAPTGGPTLIIISLDLPKVLIECFRLELSAVRFRPEAETAPNPGNRNCGGASRVGRVLDRAPCHGRCRGRCGPRTGRCSPHRRVAAPRRGHPVGARCRAGGGVRDPAWPHTGARPGVDAPRRRGRDSRPGCRGQNRGRPALRSARPDPGPGDRAGCGPGADTTSGAHGPGNRTHVRGMAPWSHGGATGSVPAAVRRATRGSRWPRGGGREGDGPRRRRRPWRFIDVSTRRLSERLWRAHEAARVRVLPHSASPKR